MVFMKLGKIFIVSTLLLIAASPCAQGRELLDSICSLGLPVMCIETVDHEEPTCDYVSPPSGSIGAGITNATKVPMRVTIHRAGDGEVLFDSGDYVEDTSGATVKIRGNTSAYAAKKPFKIKLQKKADLLLRGDKRFNDKNWLLITDDELMTTLGFIVSDIVKMEWTPRGQYVNLIFNGDYRGVYYLLEQVKRNNDCRLRTEKSGFIVELDPYWWLETDCYIVSPLNNRVYNYTYKYPEPEDVTPEQVAYITDYMTAYENAIVNATFPDYIDVSSLANWYLGHDILGTYDSGGTNKYFLKRDDSDTTILTMPLLWDFDSALQMNNSWSRVHTDNCAGKRLFNNANKAMVKQYQRRWRYLSSIVYDEVMGRFDEFANSDQGRGYNLSRPADDARWNVQHNSVENCRSRLDTWMKNRVKYLNKNIPKLYTNPFAVGDVNEDGVVDGVDINLVINQILGVSQAPFAADCNGDAVVNAIDLNMVINGVLAREE